VGVGVGVVLVGRGVGVVWVGVGVGVIECVGVGVVSVGVGVRGVGAAMHPHWSSLLLLPPSPLLPSSPLMPLMPLMPLSPRVTALLAVPRPACAAVAATAGWATMNMAMAPAAATGPTASQA